MSEKRSKVKVPRWLVNEIKMIRQPNESFNSAVDRYVTAAVVTDQLLTAYAALDSDRRARSK
jgi:hypothetical protein